MNNYTIEYKLLGAKHSLQVMANDEHNAKMILRDKLISDHIEVWLADIISIKSIG